MKRTIVLYALSLAVILFLLKFLQYRYLIADLSLEFYLGTVAALFTVFGIWLGLKLTRRKKMELATGEFKVNAEALRGLGISSREYEVLELMAKGHSNQEIADKLFISLNTVKTHSSNLFLKLEVKRRTQAIQKAKEMMLLP